MVAVLSVDIPPLAVPVAVSTTPRVSLPWHLVLSEQTAVPADVGIVGIANQQEWACSRATGEGFTGESVAWGGWALELAGLLPAARWIGETSRPPGRPDWAAPVRVQPVRAPNGSGLVSIQADPRGSRHGLCRFMAVQTSVGIIMAARVSFAPISAQRSASSASGPKPCGSRHKQTPKRA